MLTSVAFNPTTLDYGIPGISPIHMLVLFLMMFAVSMIPYLFLLRSLRDAPKSRKAAAAKSFAKMIEGVRIHHHAEPLHH